MGQISEHLKYVEEKIAAACARAGRTPSEVTLLAVSKTKPVECLREAYDAGARQFGENKVQELQEKIPALPEDISWHMIGHLQTNKIKYIVGKVALIHSVDSLRLAEAIEKEAAKRELVQDILVEVNVAGEESKFGSADLGANEELIRQIGALPHLRLRGLMTIAPYTEEAEENRGYFRTLREFLYGRVRECVAGEPILSMGMTRDYEVAVEEGATHVRVGTGIFGARDYTQKLS